MTGVRVCGYQFTNVLEQLHECLHAYVQSRQRLDDFLSPDASSSLIANPCSAVQLIGESYHCGTLDLRDFTSTQGVRGPERHYQYVKEAEECITKALVEVYGDRMSEDAPMPERAAAGSSETSGERSIKSELERVVFAPTIRKEIGELKSKFAAIASDKSTYPTLNKYFAFNVFDRRLRPVIRALELGSLPPECVVGRVEHFLHVLYRNVTAKLSAVAVVAPK